MIPEPTGTEKAVCDDIARRQQLGLAKYGVSVRDNPLSLREWTQHAYEETLDQAVYLKRIIEELVAAEFEVMAANQQRLNDICVSRESAG